MQGFGALRRKILVLYSIVAGCSFFKIKGGQINHYMRRGAAISGGNHRLQPSVHRHGARADSDSEDASARPATAPPAAAEFRACRVWRQPRGRARPNLNRRPSRYRWIELSGSPAASATADLRSRIMQWFESFESIWQAAAAWLMPGLPEARPTGSGAAGRGRIGEGRKVEFGRGGNLRREPMLKHRRRSRRRL